MKTEDSVCLFKFACVCVYLRCPQVPRKKMTIITIMCVHNTCYKFVFVWNSKKNSIILYYIIVFRQWPKDVVHACSLLLYNICVWLYLYTRYLWWHLMYFIYVKKEEWVKILRETKIVSYLSCPLYQSLGGKEREWLSSLPRVVKKWVDRAVLPTPAFPYVSSWRNNNLK